MALAANQPTRATLAQHAETRELQYHAARHGFDRDRRDEAPVDVRPVGSMGAGVLVWRVAIAPDRVRRDAARTGASRREQG